MSAAVVDAGAALLARLHSAIDDLLGADVIGLSDDHLLELWRGAETVRRRLAAVDHAVVSEAAARHLDHTCGAASMTALVRQVLRVPPGEARARVRAAEAAGPRRALSGEALAPIYPQVAAAQGAGEISERHAALIIDTIEHLPDGVRAADAATLTDGTAPDTAADAGTGTSVEESVERFLVEQARQFDPATLATIARRVSDTLDPDGTLKDYAYRRRHRYLDLHPRPDGSAHLEGDLDAECAEKLRTVLDTLAAPRPVEQDGVRVPDQRTAGQRRHDALHHVLHRTLAAGDLPTCGGIATTVILTMTRDQLTTGTGLARTATAPSSPPPKPNTGPPATPATSASSSTAPGPAEPPRFARAPPPRGCSPKANDWP